MQRRRSSLVSLIRGGNNAGGGAAGANFRRSDERLSLAHRGLLINITFDQNDFDGSPPVLGIPARLARLQDHQGPRPVRPLPARSKHGPQPPRPGPTAAP